MSETDIVIINAVKDDMLKLSKRSVVITSYDLMVNLQTSLEEASFQFIILVTVSFFNFIEDIL